MDQPRDEFGRFLSTSETETTEQEPEQMSTVTDVQNENTFEPQVVYIIDVDEDTAIANMERDSLEINLEEDSDGFEPHSRRQITTSATTSQTSLSFTLSRNEDSEAMGLLGIRDDMDDGLYIRGAEREKDRIELWYYPGDADPTTDEPDLIDAFEDVRTDATSVATETVAATLEVEMFVNGNVYWATTTDVTA